MRANNIPNSYKRIMGIATMLWLIGSGVGVIIAAITKASTIAQRRNLPRRLGVAMPSLDNMNMMTGVSKAMPTASRKWVTKLRNSEMVGVTSIEPKLSKKFRALGNTKK